MQSPYITKIRNDVAMSFTTYIANSGGLLGLCIGFSFMSGIEIVFYACWLFGEYKKRSFPKPSKNVIHPTSDHKPESDSEISNEDNHYSLNVIQKQKLHDPDLPELIGFRNL